MKSETFGLLSWDSPHLPGISELAESVGRLWLLNTRRQKGTGLEGPGDERGRENLSSDEGETMTAPAVEDVPRPTGAYFTKCTVQFTQILFSTLCSAVYKDATNTISRSYLSIKQNTYSSLRTPGFASVHEPGPDAAFVSGNAKRNPIGLRAEEHFGLLIAGAEP